MEQLSHLFENNRRWVARMTEPDSGFFVRLSKQQQPQYLWIGCADSRVPANEIVGLLPGELFVHRNISNVVSPTDPNCLSVIHYAVDVLKVRHIIVCGHYGCGGIEAVFQERGSGFSDDWLDYVRLVKDKHWSALGELRKVIQRNRLCELNVIEQAVHVAETSVLQKAWARGQKVTVHGWIYGIENGLLRDLEVNFTRTNEMAGLYESALGRLSHP